MTNHSKELLGTSTRTGLLGALVIAALVVALGAMTGCSYAKTNGLSASTNILAAASNNASQEQSELIGGWVLEYKDGKYSKTACLNFFEDGTVAYHSELFGEKNPNGKGFWEEKESGLVFKGLELAYTASFKQGTIYLGKPQNGEITAYISGATYTFKKVAKADSTTYIEGVYLMCSNVRNGVYSFIIKDITSQLDATGSASAADWVLVEFRVPEEGYVEPGRSVGPIKIHDSHRDAEYLDGALRGLSGSLLGVYMKIENGNLIEFTQVS